MYADKNSLDARYTDHELLASEGSPSQHLTPSSLASALRQKGPTIVAAEVTMTGGLTATGVVEIHGTIIGDVCCAELEIGPKGRIEGNIIANDIVVAGEVRGSIYTSQIELRNSARIDGDMHYQSLTKEAGTDCEDETDCQSAQTDAAPELADCGDSLPPPQISPRPVASLNSWVQQMLRKLKRSQSEERARVLASRFDGSQR